jgi:hypothetical protein
VLFESRTAFQGVLSVLSAAVWKLLLEFILARTGKGSFDCARRLASLADVLRSG